jgi:pimeloyl-ACP methyl ester carboxylesterase
MNPFFFGSGSRRLFGIYTPARAPATPPRAAVLCSPWGQEYLRAHRTLRQLALQLARAGVDVLRFDYHGTGDSAGEPPDASLVEWHGDIGMAIDELRDITGVERVGLVGLRLGATLAARVAAERADDVDRLVLWDPVVAGAEYLDELRAAASRSAPGGGLEVLGFVLTDAMARELRSVDLHAAIPALPERTLALLTDPLPSHAALRGALRRRVGSASAVEHVESLRPWVEDRSSGVGAVPVKLLQRIVEWWS